MNILACATHIAINDPGTEKLLYLCWIVSGVKELPLTFPLKYTKPKETFALPPFENERVIEVVFKRLSNGEY